jgi:glycosyltransferase involved in cell wall biosynthesis
MEDNCSTDNSFEIAKYFQKKDSRIKLSKNKFNIGSTKNLNQLMRAGKGKYCTLVGAHDLRQHNMISTLVSILEADESIMIAHPKALWINDEDTPVGNIKSALTTTQIKSNVARVCTVLFSHGYGSVVYGLMRYSALRKINLDAEVISCDILWLAEMSVFGSIVYEPRVTLYCRQVPTAGGWNRYVERVYGKSFDELSPKKVISDMAQTFKTSLSRHFSSEEEKRMVVIAVMLAMQTKYSMFTNLKLFRDGDTELHDAWVECFDGISNQIDLFLDKVSD